MASAPSAGRLLAEARETARRPADNEFGIHLAVDHENLSLWTAVLLGQRETVYRGGQFRLRIRCPPNYPIEPPSVIFGTPIFHPNIHFESGQVCMDVLKQAWSPAWTLFSLCQALLLLLAEPNADSPLNCDAGLLLRRGDRRGFDSVARYYVKKFATPPRVKKPSASVDDGAGGGRGDDGS